MYGSQGTGVVSVQSTGQSTATNPSYPPMRDHQHPPVHFNSPGYGAVDQRDAANIRHNSSRPSMNASTHQDPNHDGPGPHSGSRGGFPVPQPSLNHSGSKGILVNNPTSNPGYDYETEGRPTDFDALFTGKSRPSVVVSGLDGTSVLTGKASRVLGCDTPSHDLVYENSGFSRNVHFDISQLPQDLQDTEVDEGEYYATKRRGPKFPFGNAFSFAAESIAAVPKKSKSRLVSLSKMNKNARWLEWSEKMRVENQIKKEEFLKKREEAAKNKLPAAIIKARKESVKFVNDGQVPSDDETPMDKLLGNISAQNGTMVNSTRSKHKYSEEQWMKLHEYWDHALFRKCRMFGYLIAIVALFAAIPPVLSTRWVTYDIKIPHNFTWSNSSVVYVDEYGGDVWNCSNVNDNGTCYEQYYEIRIEIHGFWYNCTTNVTSYSGINDDECAILQFTGIHEWQSAIIGLLLFALAFGFLATILTTCGVCALSLSKKVYYYHSAGEIYFVCGVCATAALITYPAVMKSVDGFTKLGIGYYLAWGMPICFFLSAFCMTLDDMIHSLTNNCCLACKGGKQAQTNHV